MQDAKFAITGRDVEPSNLSILSAVTSHKSLTFAAINLFLKVAEAGDNGKVPIMLSKPRNAL